ncbi:MAG: hypothetical protein M3154_05535, partial [Candidatus Eremiobacteraeota bacterium]|nr:hypothetical protein [Candidatus Eremiobacteraeota bacterium]
FDSSMFGARFDFFLARSIWTHAAKGQIVLMLDAFVRDSLPTSVLLASYIPTTSPDPAYQARLTAANFPPREDDGYAGERWVGTSHESSTPGMIQHSLRWIREQCAARALAVTEMPGVDCDGQIWLRVQHDRAPVAPD